MIDNLLKKWGIQQRQLPQNNTILKEKLLGQLVPTPKMAQTSKSLPWFSIFFTTAAVAVFMLSVGTSQHKIISDGILNTVTNRESSKITSALNNIAASPTSMDAPMADSYGARNEQLNKAVAPQSTIYYSPPNSPPNDSVAISDNRELLKYYYSAELQSTNVSNLSQRVQTTVRGFEGRIDSSSSSVGQSYISFVLPANKLDAFKAELKDITGEKFYMENLQSQNYLPEQKSIEQQQSAISSQISDLSTQKQQVEDSHQKTSAYLQSQINSNTKQFKDTQVALAIDPNNTDLQTQLKTFTAEVSSLKKQLAQENSNYTAQSNSIDQQIKYLQDSMQNLSEQSGQLMDNVATVSGSIQISHISWFGVSNIYLTPFWLPSLLIILAIGSYLFHRKNKQVML